ncbi:DUF6691 family protein [Sphingomicrobium sediminis]|uniref:YeeE/YedE family protein n=1 Tax=Sphingomicrobium sediminis TaxID=2950949 RepID=A0A9X2EGU5_9SPHN|nr:DUF6691 family protein [Sphingomicrobium sediminis]MCM8556411.1 YeeE/YedE family protein [Sphingomicrobium sediminis]
MKQQVLTLVAGSLFGAGLAISGMMDPLRVRGFLDLFGNWDPTLAFVMGGALLVMAVAWLIQRRLEKPYADDSFHLPGTQQLDRKLLGGAALFGIGWGLSGLCPGPAVASIGVNFAQVALFIGALFAGMLLHRLLPEKG